MACDLELMLLTVNNSGAIVHDAGRVYRLEWKAYAYIQNRLF